MGKHVHLRKRTDIATGRLASHVKTVVSHGPANAEKDFCILQLNGKTFYDTKEECRLEMLEVAKYAANLLQKVTKPYCFKIEVYSA